MELKTPGDGRLDVDRLLADFEAVIPLETPNGRLLWRAQSGGITRIVHLVSSPSNLWHERSLRLQSDAYPVLPKIHHVERKDSHTLVQEEELHGRSWKQLELTPARSRELGVELFDALELLHSQGVCSGPLEVDQLLLDSSNRLRLLYLIHHDPVNDPPHPVRRDLDSAIDLLSELPLTERSELKTLESAGEVSRALRGQTHRYEYAEPPLVGRESAWRDLDRAFGRRHLLTLEGPAGGGKTRLLRDWSSKSGARVLWAKAERETAPSPFSMFLRPLQKLEEELDQRPDLVTTLVHSLGVELPLLDSLRGRRQKTSGLQYGTLVMLGLTLAVFGKDRPSVLILDDCQWADSLTLRFLEYWAAHGESMLVVASFRGDEVPAESPLRQLKAEQLVLPPLENEDAQELLRGCHPSVSATLLDRAITIGEGNPFTLLCLLRTGMLPGDLSNDRLSKLPTELRSALEIASVLGRQFSVRTVEGCLRRAVDFTPAFEEGFLRRPGSSPVFAHDRIRDLILASLHADRLSELHLLVARYLASQDPPSVFESAFHFQAAGAAQEGFEFARQAGFEARDAHALTVAIFYFQAALDGSDGRERTELQKLWSELGDCYRLTGHYEEARDALERSASLADDKQTRARLQWSLGDVHFKQGDLEAAREALRVGLKLLGAELKLPVLLDFAWQAVIQCLHTHFPERYLGRRRESTEALNLLRADFYNRLAYTEWFLSGPIPSIRAHLRELNLAEGFQPSRTLARARASHAIAMSTLPMWGRATRFGAQAIATARELGDDWGEGQACHFHGAALLGSTRFEEARVHLEQGIRKLGLTGDRWEENGARYHLALVHLRLGEMEKAKQVARSTQEIGVEINDRLAAGDNLFTWARATYGQIPREILEREKEHSCPDIQRAAELLGAEALLNLQKGEYQQGAELLDEAIAVYRRRRASTLYSAPLFAWALTAKRLVADQELGQGKTGGLIRVQRAAALALRVSRRYQGNLPHALREAALVYRLSGEFEVSSQHLNESLAVAQRLGMTEEWKLGRALTNLWQSDQKKLDFEGHPYWMFTATPSRIR